MKWALLPSIAFVLYGIAFSYMCRYSNLCYLSDDPSVPQPFLAYGFHPDPEVNAFCTSVFAPFVASLDPNKIAPDPGDFSAKDGLRIGFGFPVLLLTSSRGKLMLIAFCVSLAVIAGAVLPRLFRSAIIRPRRPQGSEDETAIPQHIAVGSPKWGMVKTEVQLLATAMPDDQANPYEAPRSDEPLPSWSVWSLVGAVPWWWVATFILIAHCWYLWAVGSTAHATVTGIVCILSLITALGPERTV